MGKRIRPSSAAIDAVFDIDIHCDVSQQRTDATLMCVEVLRAIGHTLQAGEDTSITLHVPADPVTASVLGASLLRLAMKIERPERFQPPKVRTV